MLDSTENLITGWISASLVRKVGAGLVVMAVLMLLAIAGVFLQVRQQQTDASVISVAAQQGMLNQRIANRSQSAIKGEAKAMGELQTAAEMFDRSLRGLRDGDVELGLPPAPASVRPQLDVVNESWDPTYKNIQTVLETASAGSQVRVAAQSLYEGSEVLLTASEAVLTELKHAGAPISAVSFGQLMPISGERIANFALKIAQGQIGFAPQLAEEAQRFDEVLYVLKLGGESSPAWEQLLAVEAVWKPFYTDVQALLAASEKGLQADRAVVVGSEPLLQASDMTVTLFEREAQGKVARLQQFLVAVTVVFLLVFGFVVLATRRAIRPLVDMSCVAARIAEGDMSSNIVLSSRDEIGRLAAAFNSMAAQLRGLIASLEERVVARTRRLEIVATLGERLSAILDFDRLLAELVNQVKESFGYYHVHVYIVDDSSQNLVVTAGTGEAGAEMKARGHSIPLNAPTSPIACAARMGQVVRIDNVQETEAWLPDPLLPRTCSEMAVPIMLGVEAQMVGVLDVQADEVAGLDEGDANMLRSLANQVAIAIKNARLYEQAQQEIVERRRAEAALRESEARYRDLYEDAPIAYYSVGLDGRIRKANRYTAEMSGYALDDLIGRPVFDLYADTSAGKAKAQQVFQRFRTGEEVRGEELEWQTADGKLLRISITVRPFRDVEGRVVESRAMAVDITERRQAEEALRAYAAKLERSNRELQDFAFIASHDLQEPLRKVQAFGDRLQAKYGEMFDERGRDYLMRMQDAAARMQQLINGLLTYSRVTTKARPFVPVDLVSVARDVVSDLETRIEQVGGRVEVGELPTVEADPFQMRQLLQNLISNALKFHREDELPLVRIQARMLNGQAGRLAEGASTGHSCQITVADNGIGFDEKYLDRIFQVFQQLHGRHQYDGTGIGLATCRKIVERHGGSLTAKSTPGQGTTFVVTLPLKQSPGENGQ